MRNRSILYFAGFLIATVGFLMFDYSLRKKYVAGQYQPRAVVQDSAKNDQSVVSDIELRPHFLSRFKNFSIRMAALDDDPERSEKFLSEFSETIKPSDIATLNDLINDDGLRSDERTLALELMVMNQDFVSHNFLNSFVQNEKFSSRSNVDFELALRAQAIEGMTLFTDKKLVQKNLENLKVRTRYAFLNDRANRALSFLNDQNLAIQMDDFSDAKASKR